jgi:hypothetical protein
MLLFYIIKNDLNESSVRFEVLLINTFKTYLYGLGVAPPSEISTAAMLVLVLLMAGHLKVQKCCCIFVVCRFKKKNMSHVIKAEVHAQTWW